MKFNQSRYCAQPQCRRVLPNLVVALMTLIGGAAMNSGELAFAQTSSPQSVQTLDDQFSAVAKQVPEFGGMFLSDDQATLYVYLTNPARDKIAAVRAAIVNVFGDKVVPKNGISARRGSFGFEQLREWYRAMVGPVLRAPGVTMTDIDEAKNRLSIGVQKESDKAAVGRLLEAAKIPTGAVNFLVTDRVAPVATLQGHQRPTVAGYQIAYAASSTTFVECSLGFTARSGATTGFVTASHCTKAPWAVDGTPFNQPTVIPVNYIGAEAVDPPGFTCPPTYQGSMCRWSDSVFVPYAPGVPSGFALIGRTTGISSSWLTPNVTINNSKPTFGLVGPPSQPFLTGLALNKVGMRSGWSQGTISNTCVDFAWTPLNNAQLLCQYVVHCSTNACAVEGDSGSPVFRVTNSVRGYSELYGILWARFFGSHVWLIFSPITGIQADLGQLEYSDPCMITPNPC